MKQSTTANPPTQTYDDAARGLLLIGLLLGLLEPFDERLGGLADLLGDGQVDVLLGSLGTPLGGDLLGDEVVVVVELQDLDDLLVDVGVLLAKGANKTLGATEEGLLVTLRRDDLEND